MVNDGVVFGPTLSELLGEVEQPEMSVLDMATSVVEIVSSYAHLAAGAAARKLNPDLPFGTVAERDEARKLLAGAVIAVGAVATAAGLAVWAHNRRC